MSRETLATLNTQTLIGFADRRGTAWHYRRELQGAESNHYSDGVPVDDVLRRLFHWRPVSIPLEVPWLTADGVSHILDETRQVIIRPDTQAVMGVFKAGYKVHPYDEWLLKNLRTLWDTDELGIASAGLLSGGARAWVQIEAPETREVEGVKHRPFVTAATSCDGSLATTYGRGTTAVVCDNTLSVALGEFSASVKVKHSRNSLGRLTDVRDALHIVHEAGDAFEAQVRALIAQPVSEARFDRFVKAYSEPKSDGKRAQTLATNKTAALWRLWSTDLRVSPWRGTAYGVLTAVNTYTQHEQDVRGAERAIRHMEQMVTGAHDKTDAETLKLLATVV